MDEQPFTIRGIYTTRTPGYDESTVFMPLAKAQAITRAERHASIIFVLLQRPGPDRRRAAAALQEPAVPGRDLGATERAADADRGARQRLHGTCST